MANLGENFKEDFERRFFDTHCHLHYMQDPDKAIKNSFEKGVDRIMCVSTSQHCPEKMLQIIDSNQTPISIYYSVGVHPKDVKHYTLKSIEEYLQSWLEKNQARAIGETGLDDYTEISEEELQAQIDSFKLHIAYAKKYDLPIIMHLRCKRGSNRLELLAKDIIRGCGAKGIAHCFGGSYDMAKFLIEEGWFISVAGNITYGSDLHEAIRLVPEKQLLIETDAPFLPPEPCRVSHRNKNDSSLLPFTFQALCNIRGARNPQSFMAVLYDNSLQIFGLTSHQKNATKSYD